MLVYLIKTCISLAVFYLLYLFISYRTKTFKFLRWYLLFTVLFTLLLPFIEIELQSTSTIKPVINIIENYNISYSVENVNITKSSPTLFSMKNILVFIYIFISGLLLLRFLINLFKIIVQVKTKEIVNHNNFKFVLTDDKTLPFTFLKYIFVNEQEFKKKSIPKELFIHEEVHCKQLHSIDIILVEVVKIVLWANPFVWIFRKIIQKNHEYIADSQVLIHCSIKDYQRTLLNLVFRNNSIYLASDLNYSLTKKRLIMMTKNKSKSSLIRKFAIIPIVAVLVLTLSCKKEESYIEPRSISVEKSIKNIKQTWWYPIIKEHNIELGNYSYNNSIFEMANNTVTVNSNSIILENLVYIIKEKDGYSIFYSPKVNKDIRRGIISGGEVEIIKFQNGQKSNIKAQGGFKIEGIKYHFGDVNGIVYPTN